MKSTVICVALCISVVCCEFIQIPKLQVRISNGGIIQAKEHTDPKFYSYEGIPYAKPPIGKYRFRAPREADRWSGVLNGDRPVPSCIQIPQRSRDWYESEDCLYLNVFTPQAPWKENKLRPVMVWIYGGAFLWGIANSSYFGPEFLIEKDVVVVHFNYRVNVFGFLSTGDMSSPGNYGLKDQLQVFRWVKNNIIHFGGDPNQITIFGESAGGASVLYHILSSKSRGLFEAAIVESGSVLCPWALQTNPLSKARRIGELTGFLTGSSNHLVEHLRRLDARILTRATLSTTLLSAISATKGLPFSPTLEPEHSDAFLTLRSHQLLSEGKFDAVPLVIGFNSQESAGAQSVLQLGEPVLRMISNHKPLDFLIPPGLDPSDADVEEISDAIKRFYFSNDSISPAKQYLDFISDNYFYRPVLETARLYSARGPTFFYRFSYDGYELGKKAFALNKDNEVQGVQHAEEVWYIFRRDDLGGPTPRDELARSRMVTMWTNFAKYRVPTPVADPLLKNVTWPGFNSHEWLYLDIGDELRVESRFKEKMVRFWSELFGKYGRPPYDTY